MVPADFGQSGGVIVAAAITVTAIVILGVIIVWGHRKFVAAADRAKAKLFNDAKVATTAMPGSVFVKFHVYCGLIVFCRQSEYQFWAPPDDARLVLSRMNRFNFTWGFFAYGALIIPILSLGNYWAQRFRISRQAAKIEGK